MVSLFDSNPNTKSNTSPKSNTKYPLVVFGWGLGRERKAVPVGLRKDDIKWKFKRNFFSEKN